MSDSHLKVPIDARFFTRLSGRLMTAAGMARDRGDKQAAAILLGLSESIFTTLTELGDEVVGGDRKGTEVQE